MEGEEQSKQTFVSPFAQNVPSRSQSAQPEAQSGGQTAAETLIAASDQVEERPCVIWAVATPNSKCVNLCLLVIIIFFGQIGA